MKRYLKKIEAFVLTRDVWLHGTALLAISLILTNETPAPTWSRYLAYVLALAGAFAPVLLFEWHKERLKKRTGRWIFFTLWLGCYVATPLFLAWISQLWPSHMPFIWLRDTVLLISALVLGTLALCIEANHLMTRRFPIGKGLQRIGLEHGILLVLGGFALMFTLMAGSNLPIYLKTALIYPSVKIGMLLENGWALPLLFIQFAGVYLAGYFFYVVNHYMLVPVLLKKRGLLIYVGGVIGVVVLFYPFWAQLLLWTTFIPGAPPLLPSENEIPFEIINGGATFALMIGTLPLIVALQWFKQNQEITALKHQKSEAELTLLKQQINPHFFFNTLNNLYALSLTQSPQTPEMILRLSDLMRYVIYEGPKPEVLLSQEVQYLSDYIELQRLRLHNALDYKFDQEIQEASLMIPPLLLIILVENAFKHGVAPAEEAATLHLRLTSSRTKLVFTCTNTVAPTHHPDPGIGLENLRRRLALRFPNRHTLDLNAGPQSYTATLTLTL